MDQPSLFISHSHKDKEWLNRLRLQLAASGAEASVEVWSDEKIAPGGRWAEEITKAIERSRIALLLISPHYLSSKMIFEFEVPLLLAEEKRGLRIVPLLLAPCDWQQVSWLSKTQMYPRGAKPLSSLRGAKRDEALVEIVSEILQLLDLSQSEEQPIDSVPEEAVELSSAEPVAGGGLLQHSDLEDYSAGARECLGFAAAFAKEANASAIDSVLILAGCLQYGAVVEVSGFFAPCYLVDFLRKHTPELREDLAGNLGLRAQYGIESLPSKPLEGVGSLTDDARRLLLTAYQYRQETSRDRLIHARHLVAALVAEPHGDQPQLKSVALLRERGYDLDALRRGLWREIRESVPEDNQPAWEDLLSPQGHQLVPYLDIHRTSSTSAKSRRTSSVLGAKSTPCARWRSPRTSILLCLSASLEIGDQGRASS